MKRLMLSALYLIPLLFTLLSCQKESIQADYQIIPLPQQIQLSADKTPFTLNSQTQILYPAEDKRLQDYAQLLAQYIKTKTHKEIAINTSTDTTNAIILQILPKGINPEGYQLDVNSRHVIINGNSEAGVFYGIQTLRNHYP